MDALECIKGRRSVRRFTGEAVTKDDVLKVVESARFAPTWKNSQTVRYIAVLDAAVKDRIAAEGLGGFAWNAQIIGGTGERRLSPQSGTKRSEAAAMLHRFDSYILR